MRGCGRLIKLEEGKKAPQNVKMGKVGHQRRLLQAERTASVKTGSLPLIESLTQERS